MKKTPIHSKYLSISDIQSSFKNKTLSPSFFYSGLIKQTIEFNQVFRSYNQFDQTKINKIISNVSDEIKKFNFTTKRLLGIPFNIKDSFISKEFETSYGLKDTCIISSKNSAIISLFEKEGAILFGKTFIPPYAYDVQTYNEEGLVLSNPWNLNCNAGGSTGGGAVSVATGQIPIAIGSDFAGSIRIPAHFCGIKGYIPTDGNKFLSGHYPDKMKSSPFEFYVGQVGFLSNNLSDFNIINTILHPLEENIISNFINKFEIDFLIEDDSVPVSKDIKNSILSLKSKLISENWKCSDQKPINFSFRDVGKLHARLMNTMFSSDSDHIPLEEDNIQKRILAKSLDEYLRNRFWILPVSSTCAVEHNIDHNPIKVDEKSIPYWRAMIHYVRPFNLMNCPIIVMPIGINSKGLPIGIQIIASEGNDFHLIAFAKYLESLIDSIGHPNQISN